MITEEMIQKVIDEKGERAEWYNIANITLVQAHDIVNECRLSIGEYPTLEEIEDVMNEMDINWSHNPDSDTYFISKTPLINDFTALMKEIEDLEDTGYFTPQEMFENSSLLRDSYGSLEIFMDALKHLQMKVDKLIG